MPQSNNPITGIMKYDYIDLGERFEPHRVAENQDVIGAQFSLADPFQSNPVVRRHDGAMIPLPSEFAWGVDINAHGKVVAQRKTLDYATWDIATNTTVKVDVAGNKRVVATAIDDAGRILANGLAGFAHVEPKRFSYLLNPDSSVISTVAPDGVPAPSVPPPGPSQPSPDGTSYLRIIELLAINAQGHAVGRQGKGFGGVEGLGGIDAVTPVYWNGSTVTVIGPEGTGNAADAIGNDDRVGVTILAANGSQSSQIWSAASQSATPFASGTIVAVNALGQTLWQDALLSGFIVDAGITTPIQELIPANVGMTDPVPMDMNEAGVIVGMGSVGASWRGFMLVPSPTGVLAGKLGGNERAVAMILWGIINDGGGLELVGGRPKKIPPWGPLSEMLGAFPPGVRERITAALARNRVSTRADAQAFAAQVRRILRDAKRG